KAFAEAGIGLREQGASFSELRNLLRRAWLARDFEVVTAVMHELAPRHDYRASELASALQMTHRHLQRIFASTLGVAPQEWLNQQRIQAATQLLAPGQALKAPGYTLA